MPNGQVGKENDLTVGQFVLVATVGASFSSKRMEMVEMMMQAMQYAPNLAMVIAPLMFKFSDMPGAQEIYAKVKKQADMMQQQQMQLQQAQIGEAQSNMVKNTGVPPQPV